MILSINELISYGKFSNTPLPTITEGADKEDWHMTSKQNLRADNVQAVTMAALNLFYKNGIDKTTINDIAALAGVSKMSVFRYYATKADIVVATTKEFFKYMDEHFMKNSSSNDDALLTGMGLVENYLSTYYHLIDAHIEFANYLCEVMLFFSKQSKPYHFPKDDLLEEYWIKALERGMRDKTIAPIPNYETSHHTIHNLFMGVNLRLYLKNKSLSDPDTVHEVKDQTRRIIDMIIKYLAP